MCCFLATGFCFAEMGLVYRSQFWYLLAFLSLFWRVGWRGTDIFWLQFGNVRGDSPGVQTVVGQKGLFPTPPDFWSCHKQLMANGPKSDASVFCPMPLFVEQNQHRDRTKCCHRNFTRISSEVAPLVVFSHKPLRLKAAHGIVGARSWTGFLKSTMSL